MKVPQKLQGILGSSQNPEELSLTVKGVLVGLLPLSMLLLPLFGITASQELLQDLINAGFGLFSAGLIFYGVLRKFKK